MGKVVTVMNMKGGVGKTTITANAALRVSRINKSKDVGRRVLVIDYDPQFNLSQALLPSKQYFELEKKGKTVLSVLQEDSAKLDPFKLMIPGSSKPPKVAELAAPIRLDSVTGGRLDLIPSTLSLMYVALGQADGQVDVIERRFSEFIREATKIYDLILIDCHPAGSLMTRTALSNSDHVVIPVAPSNYSLRGIALMMDFISKAKQPGSAVGTHILFNRVERKGVSSHETTVRANPRFAGYCLKSTLKQYKVFSDLAEGRGFVDFSSKPYSTEAFHNLNEVCRELLARVGA